MNEGRPYSTASTAEINTANALDQSQCILYKRFPAEIRNCIFEYAVASVDDFDKPYRLNRVYCRPGHLYHQKTDISLLRTCKRVFAEARLMPVAQTGTSILAVWWTVQIHEDRRQGHGQV